MSSAFEDIHDSYNQMLGDYRIREHDYDDYYTRLSITDDLDMRIALNKQCPA
jgi:hypothetical protein